MALREQWRKLTGFWRRKKKGEEAVGMHPILRGLQERLGEDEGLTAELTDTAAIQLLRWAEQEIARWNEAIADQPDPEAWAERRWTVLHRHLRRVAREAAQAADPQAVLPGLLVSPDYEE